jgi:hypothetical protein
MRASLSLAQLLLHRLFRKLAGIDPELLLEQLGVLLVVDLLGKLLRRLLDVLVLAFLPRGRRPNASDPDGGRPVHEDVVER